MSYNQPRPDTQQYRRTGRSTGYHQQQQQQQPHRSSTAGYGRGAGGGPPPASSAAVDPSNRSFKKPGNNAQGGHQQQQQQQQPRVNLPPVNSNHNGPNVQSRSQGEPVGGGPVANSTSGAAIPKAPTSQSPAAMNSKSNESQNTAKGVPGDPSKPFAFQFGSLGPDLMKIPARTSSAPPNMDEQKRAQLQQASLKPAPNVPAPVPKKDSPNKAADVQVHHMSPLNQTQKSPITHIRMPSVQTPYQHPQVPHPVHFGPPPNMHMQPPNVAPTSFQMPMPMGLPMGNTPQIHQQVFFQGPPSHPMHHQGMMHQAPQGHGFATPMGAQIHPQMGHVGVGLTPQYPQQQGGKYGGGRKTTPVKITHPDTHEELRLGGRGELHQDGQPQGPKSHPNTPPRSHPVSTFASRPLHVVQTSFNSSPITYTPRPLHVVQTDFNSGPVIDGSQRVQFTNHSTHTAPQPFKPASEAHVSSDSSSAKAHVTSSALPAPGRVTVKQAPTPEKAELPKARPHEETNVALSQKKVEAGSLDSLQQPKPGSVSALSNSTAPPAKAPVETVTVATTTIGSVKKVNESSSVEDQTRTCKVEPSHNATEVHGQTPVSDLETKATVAKENSSLPATNGFEKQNVLASASPDTRIDKTAEDLNCDEGTISGKEVDESVNSDEKLETVSGVLEKAQNEVDGATDICSDSDKSSKVADDTSSELQHSTHTQSSTVPVEHSSNSLTSTTATLSKDRTAFESNTKRPTSTKGKKKIKEILQKADAAGTTDLYNAYKGPEEKKEIAMPLESSDVSNQKLQDVVEATVDTEPVKNEPENWEDAADVSTPKLESVQGKPGSADEVRDSCSNMEKKYSRDFLLKFADMVTALPEGFDISSDVASSVIGPPHHEHGKVMDRQGSSSGRRPSNMPDDRWAKNQGSLPSGQHGGNVGFRSGQGGNSGVLRNPRMQQGPIMSRPMQPVGPMVGMGRNDMWQRGSNFQQKGLFPSPHTPMQVMHRAERKYQVGTVTDEEQAKQRQLKGILNKLTPQNFEKLFEQVKGVNIDNVVTLRGVISQIFDKALMEPTFCEMYADFCVHLSGALPELNEDGEKVTFKRLLLNKCQEEFERGEKEEEEASRVAEEEQAEQTEEEREEKRLKVRRRMLGNIRLIGELYKKRMLTEKIMHACIQKLVGYDQDPHEENIEALCKLMSTIGVMIDHSKAKVHIDTYFDRMKMLSGKEEYSSRVRFMLINAIDLRKNKWQERMKVEGPKKIEEVHRDAAQERQTQAKRLSRGPSMNVSGRRSHMEYSPRGGGGGMLSPPSAQMGGYHGPSQGRSYNNNQDIRFDERPAYEPRIVPMSQRSVGEEPITLGPQGGLGQGMSFRKPAVGSNSDPRRPAGGLNGVGSQRPASPVTHGRSSPQERGSAYVHREFASLSRASEPSSEVPSARQVPQGPSAAVNIPQERLQDMSLSAIKEYYSARDEKEIGLCIKDMNSPAFHPTMISLWVTDSFERKDKERDLLAKLLVNLVKSADNDLTGAELVKGFETVLTTLEDAVNDAPKAAEFLGKIFGKSVTENVVTLAQIGRLILEGGEEPGSLMEFGLGGDVLGSVLETIKSEAGEEAFVEIQRSSGLRIEDFKPPAPNRSKILDKFT
ncbi:eukaryotic translation initiation factor 4G-like isoform X2 [Raphanus sativus]|uniref:Eukaryotic translation initiation factor 4G n=1 Tax=Raphanus sativus TaxID=3726 RepID=A0A9W3DNV3_RAPSA|nr:eukaryotic translation initiation factor 4G-like isoform X2 [Raphanus sativus]